MKTNSASLSEHISNSPIEVGMRYKKSTQGLMLGDSIHLEKFLPKMSRDLFLFLYIQTNAIPSLIGKPEPGKAK